MAAVSEPTSSKRACDLIAGHDNTVDELQYIDEVPSFRPDKSQKSDAMETDAAIQGTSSSCKEDETGGSSQSANDNAKKKFSYSRRIITHLTMSNTRPAIIVEGATPTEDEDDQESMIRSVLTRLHIRRKDKRKKKTDTSENDNIDPKFLHPDWQPRNEKGEIIEVNNEDIQQAVKEAQDNIRKFLLLLFLFIFLFAVILMLAIIFILARTGVIKLNIEWLDLHSDD